MKNVDKYVTLVCDFLKLPEADVKSKRRDHELCEARQLISYVLKLYTRISLNDIAKLLNYVSHASPWRDKKQVLNFLEVDRKYRERITPLLIQAETLFNRLNKASAKINSDNPPELGDICWFWNDLIQNFPILGTFLKFTDSDMGRRYFSAEEPEINYLHCEFAGETVIPDSFNKPVTELNIKLNVACKSSTSPVMAEITG